MLRLALHRAARQQGCALDAVQLPHIGSNKHLETALLQARDVDQVSSSQPVDASNSTDVTASFAWRGVQFGIQSATVAQHWKAAHASLQQALQQAPAAGSGHAAAAAAWAKCGQTFEDAAKAAQAAAAAADQATEEEGCLPLLGAAAAELQVARHEAQGLAVRT